MPARPVAATMRRMIQTRDITWEPTVPVLIAGAGPAGLMAAIALARSGVETLLVERRRELSSLPRATVISTRSMELLRSFGLEEAVRAGAIEVDWRMWESETLAAAAAGSAVEVGLPTREQSEVVSPMAPECVPQDHLEPVLLDHLRTLDAARVELGTEVIAVDSRADGVARSRCARSRAPGPEYVRARYLVAADGARSTIRAGVGIPIHGPDRLMEGAQVLFRAPLWDVLGEHRYGIYSVTRADAGGVFVPAGRGDRWLYGAALPTRR